MKEIGTEWWFEPDGAGYNGVWQPAIVKIVSYAENSPKPNAPKRQYIVRFDYGTQCFANDQSLFRINALRTGPHPDDLDRANAGKAASKLAGQLGLSDASQIRFTEV